MKRCQKTYCMKQADPLRPGIYIGEPFIRGGSSMACHLCTMGFGARFSYGGPLPEMEDHEKENKTG